MNLLTRLFWPFVKVRRWWLENLTTSGNTIILGLIATANAVWGYPLGPLFSAFVVLIILTGVLNLLYKPQLEFQMRAPSEVEKGELLTLTWTVRNKRRLGAHDLSIRFRDIPNGVVMGHAPTMIDAIGSGCSITITTTVRCQRRGVFPWPTLVLTSYYPFGLFRKMVTFRPQGALAVTPRFIPLRKLRGMLATTTVTGSQLSDRQIGEAFRYLGSREFIPGTAVRRWDFSAWARLGKPIVREFESNRSPRIMIWVDGATGLLRQGKPLDSNEDLTTEAVYSLAASIARSAINGGTGCKLVLSSEFSKDKDSSKGDRRQTASKRVDEKRLDGILRRLAGGRTNTPAVSANSLNEANKDQANVDLFLLITGQRTAEPELPEYLVDNLPMQGALQVLTIDSSLNISTIRPSGRRTNASPKPRTFKQSRDSQEPSDVQTKKNGNRSVSGQTPQT